MDKHGHSKQWPWHLAIWSDLERRWYTVSSQPLQSSPLSRCAVFIPNLRLRVEFERHAFANARVRFVKGEISRGDAMHFGLHLKKKGIITAEQLVSAIETQLATVPRIGQLALEEGILMPRDIFDVLRAQSESPDVRFGEL